MDILDDVLFRRPIGGRELLPPHHAPRDHARVRLGRARLAAATDDPRSGRGRGSRRGSPTSARYRIVVLQTPAQEGWLDVIPKLQSSGTKVAFDVDYHMHAIATDRDVLSLIEALLRMCDGVICATPYIAERYARFNARTFVCENGIDLRSYALTRPPHDTVNIGWSGTTMPARRDTAVAGSDRGDDARAGR